MNKQKPSKQRADLALVERGLVDSRSKAQALIMAGNVYADTHRVNKASDMIAEGSQLTVKGKDHPWVSRGGLKLVGGLDHFGFDMTDRVVIDVGASTGGFTDVALSHGASRVYAVDVGHGQLDWKLRNDPRVVVLEKTNARYLSENEIPEPVDAVVCDASFISLKTVLPAALSLTGPDAFACALIKPQFEVGKGQVGKGGVVRDSSLHEAVVADIQEWFDAMPSWRVLGAKESPITGPEGNKEFLIGAERVEQK